MRNNLAVSEISTLLKPGASTKRTILFEKMIVRMLSNTSTSVTILMIDDASFQAFFCSLLTSNPVKTGIKADPSAPPATKLNKISENRFAAKNALLSMVVPKYLAVSVFANNPTRLLAIKAAITVIAPRAMV